MDEQQKPIDALSVRGRRTLNRLGCKSVGELQRYTVEDVRCMKNVGTTTVDELTRHLSALGLRWRLEGEPEQTSVSIAVSLHPKAYRLLEGLLATGLMGASIDEVAGRIICDRLAK